MAKEMIITIKSIDDSLSTMNLALRIGIHTGPIVAGVIGKNKFAYDLWGSTVNMASRMESTGKKNKIQISDKTYNILKEHNGKYASINGATQIRAGVIRPELVISLNDNADNCRELSEVDLIIQEGSKVRVIRQPYFGLLGTVVSLPKDPVSIDSETKARVAEIEFSNNERKLVPRANLEIILE